MTVTITKPYRFLTVESERGWGSTREYLYFETLEDAQKIYNNLQAKPGPAPDYYYIAVGLIEEINSQGKWETIK